MTDKGSSISELLIRTKTVCEMNTVPALRSMLRTYFVNPITAGAKQTAISQL